MSIGKRVALMSKGTKIGFITEDESDYLTIIEIIRKITGDFGIASERCYGKGCGKIKRKAVAWINVLVKKGCNSVILIHDADKNDHEILRRDLRIIIEGSVGVSKFVCVPREELEAWLLSDLSAIAATFSMKKRVKEISNPESIVNPKEYIARYVRDGTGHEKQYVNTRHNVKIAKAMNIKNLEKCSEFKSLKDHLFKILYK